MEELIGKKAYKKRGFFGGFIGTIQKSDSGITPYKIVFASGSAVGILDERDIEVVKDEGE